MRKNSLGFFVCLLFLFFPTFASAGQEIPGKKCPYCRNDAETLKKAGLVGHGPFPFATAGTGEVEERLGYVKEWYWLESEHFRIGLTLPKYTLPESDKGRVREELTQLEKVLPSINPKTRTLDPWLRVHLYAYRAEKFYQDFSNLMGVDDSYFGKRDFSNFTGMGPYLGQEGKFEILLLHNKAAHLDFLKAFTGLEHSKPQRHHFIKRGVLFFGCHTEEDQLSRDLFLNASLFHNLGHNFIDAFEHYSYDLPVWITCGFAHWAERQVSREYASYDFVETYKEFRRNGEGWPDELRKRLLQGKLPSLAALVRKLSYNDLDELDHMAIWSLTEFLIQNGAAKYANFLKAMKGRVVDGQIDSGGLVDAQREAIKSAYGWTYSQLEEAWHEFIRKG